MMRNWKGFTAGLLLMASLSFVMSARSDASGAKRSTKPNETQIQSQQSAGEQKFAQNCGRCHNPPEGFSSHISGTIVRHMRVRASLSKQDEEDILHFLNP